MLRVADVMTPNPQVVQPNNSVSTAVRMMLEGGFHHLPVVQEGRLVGLVHATDIRRTMGMATLPEGWDISPEIWDAVPIRQVMQLVKHTVTPDTPIGDVVLLIRKWAITGIPVIQDNALVGIITISDLLDVLEHLLSPGEISPPPAVAFVGKSGSGKTTLIEGLIPELQGRGYRVGVVKHHHHSTLVDQEGKDTWRYEKAGASPVAIVSSIQTAVFLQTERELPLDEVIARYYRDVDLVLIEGYRWTDRPKVEVHRQARSDTLLCEPEELLALVSDRAWDVSCPCFAPEDVAGIANLLEETLLHPRPKESNDGTNNTPHDH